MKPIVIVLLLLLFTLIANAELHEVRYDLGPQLFHDGDRIHIEKVQATSSGFEVGERVTVKGTYILESHPDAQIGLSVTQTEGGGRSKILPGQRLEIKAGGGEFELSIEIQHPGYLHVTFYPLDRGCGFGGVYFGTSRQMQEIRDWTFDWYVR
jgi:signal peptidase I